MSDKVLYAYNSNGSLTSVTNELGHVTSITALTTNGLPATILAPKLAADADTSVTSTTLAYDARDRLTTVTVNPGAAQAQTLIAYDAIGQITRITQADGVYLDYVWSDARRLTSVANNTGEKIEYGYNLNGDVTSSTVKTSANVITKQMTTAYDELGRLMKSIGAATQTTTLSYDRTDLQVQTKDPRNNLYGYSYDALQRLIHTQDQAGGEVTVTRNAQDVVTSYKDDRTITTSYVRNGFGEVIQEVSPDAGTTTYVRDERGLVTQMTDGRGIVTNRTYDAAGRLLTETYPAATGENVTYTYDNITTPAGNKGRGKLTRIADQSGSTAYVYNALGQVITDTRVIATKTYVTSYLYNAAGKVTQITYPSGRIVFIARNSNGQVTGVTTKQNATITTATNIATGLTYAPLSNLLTSLAHGNGLATTAGYDLDYRLSSLTLKDGATNVSALAYAYTDLVNLTGITDGVTAANSNTLGYSLANRLNAASGAWGSKSFGYDGVGNRITDNTTLLGVTTNRTQFYGSNDNRLGSIYENTTTQIRSYAYDNAGNIITDIRPGESFAYTYNKRNRLSVVTRNTVSYATYGYNALEQLTTRTTTAVGGPTGQVAYTYDLDGHLITEATASSGVKTREYIWLPANDDSPVDLPLAVIDVSTNTISFVHADHLGRPIRMTSTAKATVWQATWKPWGEVQTLSGTIANNLRTPGQYFQIETGLHYNHHRMYDPVTGRYTQPDPLRFVDGPSIYAYAKNSPFMYTDRDGQCPVCLIVAGSAALGAIYATGYTWWNYGACATASDYWDVAGIGALYGGGAALFNAGLGKVFGALFGAIGKLGSGPAVLGGGGGVTPYIGYNAAGVPYYGITNSLGRRIAEHAANGITNIQALSSALTNLTRAEARAVEQALINRAGLANLTNKINSIAESNPIYTNSVALGNSLLKAAGL